MNWKWILVGILALVLVGTVSAAVVTLNPTNDGYVSENTNQIYTAFHLDTGDVATNNDTTNYYIRTDVIAHATTDLYDYNQRGLVTFDGSLIPDSATINSATIFFVKDTVSNTFAEPLVISLIDAAPLDPALYVATDYARTTFTLMADNQTITSANKTFTLNAAGLGKVNKTGKFAFMIVNSADADGTNLTWGAGLRTQIKFRSVTSADSGNWPVLTVDYTADPPVANYTSNITNRDSPLIITFNDTTTNAPTSWNWSYTNTTPGNNTPQYLTTNNITLTLERGNWLINLTAIKGDESSTVSKWMNVSYNSADRLDMTSMPYQYYPVDHLYNVPIDKMPIDPNSTDMITNNWGTAGELYAGFGNHYAGGFDTGYAYETVDSTLTKSPVWWFNLSGHGYPSNILYPIPSPEPHVGSEYATNIDDCRVSGADCQVFIYDKDTTDLYEISELYYKYTNGSYGALIAGTFNRTNYTITAETGQGAAMAWGAPVTPLMIRYDEVASGEIHHALSMHISYTRSDPNKIWPASWGGANLVNTSINYPEHGTRFRLNNTTDISGYSPENQVILTAMKKYGVFVTGETDRNPIHAWALAGIRDSRWNLTDLRLLHNINGTSLEAIDESSLMITAESGQVNMTAWGFYHTVPVADFTAYPLSGVTPTTVTFADLSTNSPGNWSWSYSNDTVNYTWFSFDQNPAVSLPVGIYSINLTATNAAGTDDEIKVDYITVTNGMGGTATPSNPLTGSGITTAIVAALTLIGVLLIGAGTAMIIGMFGRGTMGRGDSVTSPEGMGVGVAAIAVGAMLLVVAYIMIAPLFTLAGG